MECPLGPYVSNRYMNLRQAPTFVMRRQHKTLKSVIDTLNLFSVLYLRRVVSRSVRLHLFTKEAIHIMMHFIAYPEHKRLVPHFRKVGRAMQINTLCSLSQIHIQNCWCVVQI